LAALHGHLLPPFHVAGLLPLFLFQQLPYIWHCTLCVAFVWFTPDTSLDVQPQYQDELYLREQEWANWIDKSNLAKIIAIYTVSVADSNYYTSLITQKEIRQYSSASHPV
jgi:hypothetical protein